MLVTRFKRPLVAAVTVAVALALSGAPYAAADTTVVVHGPGDLPTDGSAGIFFVDCTSPWTPVTGLDPGFNYIQEGPAPVPAGTRTWGRNIPAQTPDHAAGPFRSVSSMAGLSKAEASFYYENANMGATATGVALAGVSEGDVDGHFWMGVAPISLQGGSWEVRSAVALSYSWTRLGSSLQPTGETFAGDIGAMLTHIGTGDHDGYVGIGFGCNNPGQVDFDKAQIGDTGDVVTYDFEGLLTKTTSTAKPTTITAGRSTTLSGVMTDAGGGPFSSASLDLQAKPFGSSTWTTIGHATETFDTSQHPAVLKKKPLVATQYRWSYAGGTAADGSTSTAVTVKVHTALTARATDATVKKGSRIVVTGTTKPAKPGHTVTLWKGSSKLGTGIVKANGTYSITVKATSTGTWKLHTTIGATSGNLAGTSRTVKVVVS